MLGAGVVPPAPNMLSYLEVVVGMTLLEAHYYEGNAIGPGKSVDLPIGLPAVIRDRIFKAEYSAQQNAREAMVAGAAQLPEGHPYKMFAANMPAEEEPLPDAAPKPQPNAPVEEEMPAEVSETDEGSKPTREGSEGSEGSDRPASPAPSRQTPPKPSPASGATNTGRSGDDKPQERS
jgi:hypothetical protein